MRVTLTNKDGSSVEYDRDLGGLDPKTSPCFQCGTCCSRWQAPVDSREIQLISDRLGIPKDVFHSQYLRQYSMKEDCYLINHKAGACVFLVRNQQRAYCFIHEFKPEACSDWTPSLARKECLEGLQKLGYGGGLVKMDDLNLSSQQASGFCESLRQSARYSIMRH